MFCVYLSKWKTFKSNAVQTSSRNKYEIGGENNRSNDKNNKNSVLLVLKC